MCKKTQSIIILVLVSVVLSISVTRAEDKIACSDNAIILTTKGGKLSADAASKLEARLKESPDDLPARTQLLGYYFLKTFQSEIARKARQKHILWIIQNKPDSEIAGLPEAELYPVFDEEVYSKAKGLWLKQVQVNDTNTAVLENAANFFLIHNKKLAEDFLKKAQSVEPENPKWSERLGHLYSLGISQKTTVSKKESAIKSLEQYEKSFMATSEERNRFYMLDDLAKAAFKAEEIQKAKSHATELLDLASAYQNDWNYGNAIHHGNLILGRIALKLDNIEKAKEYLISSGKTPGSPQLNSFGPNMSLAKDLLEKGESKVVLQYLDLCRIFWEGHGAILDKWESEIQNGKMPDFGANLSY